MLDQKTLRNVARVKAKEMKPKMVLARETGAREAWVERVTPIADAHGKMARVVKWLMTPATVFTILYSRMSRNGVAFS